MRRADRLFEIIQFMRRKDLTRARDLSDALEVSERTIYRDIQDLIASGVPIEGEAGVGYVLKAGFDLPPLMFKEQEIEALVLGARIVASWADPELAAAASNVIAKVQAVIPDRLRDYMANTALVAPPHHYMEPITFDVAELRRALRSQLKVHFRYRDALAEASERTVRPHLPCLLRSRLAAVGLVRAARRFPHLPSRPHRRLRRAGRQVPARAGQDPARFPQARAGLDAQPAQWRRQGHSGNGRINRLHARWRRRSAMRPVVLTAGGAAAESGGDSIAAFRPSPRPRPHAACRITRAQPDADRHPLHAGCEPRCFLS